jgi:type I restriction enzyme S subunit
MAREMKNSGVKWIGDIPCDWGTLSPRYWISRRDAGNWGTDEKEDENDTVCIRIADFDYTKYCIKKGYEYTLRNYPKYIVKKLCLQKGDILIEKSGGGDKTPVGRTVMYDLDGPALFANFSERIRIDEPYCAKYALYAFVAHYGLGLSRLYFNQTTGLQNLIMSEFMSGVKLPLPSLDEQQAIAVFLDAKCAEIDGLLADLNAEIKTLAEYKKSIIAETVTRGLNPNAPMKQSGIPWAETIPAHWAIKKGKYTFSLLQRPVKEDDGVITCFRDGEVTLRSNRREDGFTMSAKEYGYQGIEPGDLVVHGMDGFAGSIGISDSRGKATPVLNVLDSDQNKRYLMYYLRNMAYGDVFLSLSTGIRVRSCDLNWKKLGEIRIVLPPIEEQNAIAEYIDHKIEEIQIAISTKQTQIETLKSYKASLIYEYVTGKKQVI